MQKRYIKCHKNQKGEGEGTLILIILVILSLISGIFWFIGYVKDTKNERRARARKLKEAELRKKIQLSLEKHEPKGYIYYYKPGICGEEPCKITRPYFNEDN